MLQRIELNGRKGTKRTQGEEMSPRNGTKPHFVRSFSDRVPNEGQIKDDDNIKVEESSSGESRDTIHESTFPRFSQTTHLQLPSHRQSSSTYRSSPTSSRPNSPCSSSRPSLRSSATSTNIIVDVAPDPQKTAPPRRPSIFTRLRSSISTSAISPTQRSSVQPADFQLPPESPERHFIDSIGMVIPGVCNRSCCAHTLAHFVTNWRLCDPIEYTTALADHGITYSDYCRLVTALANFLDELPNEPSRRTRRLASWGRAKVSQTSSNDDIGLENLGPRASVLGNRSTSVSAEQDKVAEQQAVRLNKLLDEISYNWQKRGLPVIVCIGSYSLFTPNRISESHVQVLHVPLQAVAQQEICLDITDAEPLSFINPFAVTKSEERSVAVSRHKSSRGSISPPSPTTGGFLYRHQQLQLRDRTRPWALWPNAIPSRKRDLMTGHADRYGDDPYFRAWMRADINSRTTCTSYAKYMIEKEDNPFINTRLDYVNPPSRTALLLGLLTMEPNKWKERYPGIVNRGNYEHNRRLECRKTVEHGSRLRIVRFAFRHPMYPPHTPEMEGLGLTKETYEAIIGRIEDIRRNYKASSGDCMPHFLASWNKIRHRSTEDALNKVSDFIKQTNASNRRVVWTIETIPGVYDRGLGRDKREWEVSAWNGEDPLELLIQLEKWGIIEKRLNIDDEEI